jgi:leucyl aminopeptidase
MTATLDISFTSVKDSHDYPLMVTATTADDGIALSSAAASADTALGGAITRAAKEAGFKGKSSQSLVIRAAQGTVVLIGTGKALTAGKAAEDVGGAVFSAFGKAGIDKATLVLDGLDVDCVADIAHGGYLASYVFKHYFTKGDRAEIKMKSLSIATDAANIKTTFALREELAAGVYMARDLVYEPANELHPESYAERCKVLAKQGVKITVLDEKAMQKEGMHLLLSVGQGSRRASRMVVMEWHGGGKEAPVALVGKGVCFDTGGISIKPAGGMEDMKWDMGGSAAVVGAMRALSGRKIKRNVVGLIGLVENMPDGEATRPGDVVSSMSGQTVEIINTDAEGRLVLADVLTYAIKHFSPQKMVNLATLTGAIIVSLGKEHAGLFSNNDALSDTLMAAGLETGEKSWRMPMGKEYDDLLKSHIADMKNIGGRWGGSITAACFLERFVEEVPWAHLDIAGMAWSDKATATVPKGGTGFGVRLLTRFLELDGQSQK